MPDEKDPLGLLKPTTDQKDPLGLLIEKKNPNGNVSQPTPKPLELGSNTFLNPSIIHPKIGYLTPISDPNVRQQEAERQYMSQGEQENQDLSNRIKQGQEFQKIVNKADPETINNWNKVNQLMANKSPDRLREYTPEEQKHYEFMQTPVGKTLGAVAYLGSKATKGSLQVIKGAAHLANIGLSGSITGNPDIENAINKAGEKADKFADFGLTKADIGRIEKSKPLSALGMAAEFAPAVATGEAANAPKALMYLQGVGQGKDVANQIEKSGGNLNPLAKEALIQGSGLVNLLLTDVFKGSKVSSALQDKVVTGIAADALKESAGKDLSAQSFKELLQNKAQSFAQKLERAPLEALGHYNETAKTFLKLNAGNFALHKAVDLLNEKPVFNESLGNLAESSVNAVTKDAPIFAAIPAIGEATKLLPNSGYKNEVVDALMKDPSPENVDAIKKNIYDHGFDQNKEGGQWSPQEMDDTFKHIDKIADAARLLPRGIPEKDHDKAVGLVLDRNMLQDKLSQIQEQKKQLDPAIQDVPNAKEQYLTDKIEQANDKLRDIAGGTKTTYSKGVGEEEGKFFKTTDGKKEEITPERYNLENTERIAKQQLNPIENESTKITPSEKEDESQRSQMAERPVDTTSTEENAKTGEEKNGKGESVVKGGDEPPLSKPRYTIKGDEIKPKEDATQKISEQESGVGEHPQGNESGETTKTGSGDSAVSTEESKRQEKETGIRNADVEAERKASIPREAKTLPEIDKEGKRLVDSGEVDPNRLADDIINTKRGVTAEEEAALLYHKTRINNRQNAILSDETPENNEANQIEYAHNEALLEKNRQATEIAGNVAGRSLSYRRQLMKSDYSLATLLRKAKLFNGGIEVDEATKKELADKSKRLEQLEKDLLDREEQIKKLQDENLVQKVKKETDFEARTEKRTNTRASLRKEREDIKAEIMSVARKSLGKLGANAIPIELAVPIAKLAKNYVMDGVLSLSQVVDKVYTDVKEHLKDVSKDDIESLIKDDFDKYLSEKNKSRLESAKKRQQTKLEDLKSGNYEKMVYSKIQVDNDYLRIRAEINREQQKINKQIADIANSKKSVTRKVVDFAVKYGRQAKLASVTVLGKLASAGLTTMGMKPITEGSGKFWSKLLPRIAQKSTVEGSVSSSAMKAAGEATGSVKSLSEAYARAATDGMKDAWDEIKKGGSDLKELYGKPGQLPAEAAEFFGHVHSAIKAPVKRFAFEHSYAKRVAKGIETGIDVTDPIIDAQNRLAAYKDADRAIFMGDNQISKIYENAVSSLENSKSGTAKTSAAILRILFPFVKVPTNIMLSSGRYAFGLIPAIAKLSQVGLSEGAKRLGAEKISALIHNGMGELTPEESDIVLRNLKHGSIGGAALAYGFFNPNIVGGYYQPGEKRKPGEVQAMHIGHIPMSLTEAPIFQAMQIGATFRRLLDAHRHKDDKISAAVLGTVSGISENVPLAEGTKNIMESLNSTNKFNKFVSSTVKGEIEPAFLQQLAQITDTKDGSLISFSDKNQNKRQPNNKHGLGRYMKEDLETGIPGLRKNVKKKYTIR